LSSYLTISEVLDRKYFTNIDIVAGNKGLGRLVKWVHVVEVIKIKSLLNGNELILTTGLGWRKNQQLFKSLLEQLIECNASGLCIEMGSSTTVIPKDIIDLANKHQFPIMIFHEEVPFVEITQDVHSLLINKQYQLISNLENYTKELNKKMLEINQFEDILVFFYQYLKVQIIAIFDVNDIKLIPEIPKHEQDELFEKLDKDDYRHHVARQPVQLLGNKYAEIIIFAYTREINEFDHLLLDRTTTALAQQLLRDLVVEEKQRMKEAEWLLDWLDGQHSEDEINEYLSYHHVNMKQNGGVVCVCKLTTNKQSKNIDNTYFKLLFRTVFEQYGFYTYCTEVRYQLVFILVNQRDAVNWKQRMIDGFARFENNQSSKPEMSSVSFGVGKFVEQLSELDISYRSAKETLVLQNSLPQESKSHFYDDLHLYHIISMMNKHGDLNEMITEHLKSIIDYDKKHHGRLMITLKTYLMSNGSKKETAKKLYIVRQTLYHRIEKLETLLGDDFMNPEKRLVLELLVIAHDYFRNTEEKQM